jgi:hypothetical protein
VLGVDLDRGASRLVAEMRVGPWLYSRDEAPILLDETRILVVLEQRENVQAALVAHDVTVSKVDAEKVDIGSDVELSALAGRTERRWRSASSRAALPLVQPSPPTDGLDCHPADLRCLAVENADIREQETGVYRDLRTDVRRHG